MRRFYEVIGPTHFIETGWTDYGHLGVCEICKGTRAVMLRNCDCLLTMYTDLEECAVQSVKEKLVPLLLPVYKSRLKKMILSMTISLKLNVCWDCYKRDFPEQAKESVDPVQIETDLGVLL